MPRGVGGKQLQAGFLGREARGQTGHATRAFTGVGKFLGRKQSLQIVERSFVEKALDAGELDTVDPAALRRISGRCLARFRIQ